MDTGRRDGQATQASTHLRREFVLSTHTTVTPRPARSALSTPWLRGATVAATIAFAIMTVAVFLVQPVSRPHSGLLTFAALMFGLALAAVAATHTPAPPDYYRD